MSHKASVSQKDIDGFCKDPCEMARLSAEEIFSIEREQVDRIHLAGLQKRFNQLAPQLPPLRMLAEENRMSAINAIDDVVPLLFPHTEYKSYPLSLIDNCRFEQLNLWLDQYTTHDMSGLDLSACQSLDDWLSIVEARTPLRVVTSSGTSGKISLLPRSTTEDKCALAVFRMAYNSFAGEQGLTDVYGANIYHIQANPRRGRSNVCRSTDLRIRLGFNGDESHVLTLGGEISTDMLWMTGRMKKAQADGMVDQLKKTKAWQRLNAKLKELEAKKTQSLEEFFKNVLIQFKDKTVVMSAGLTFYKAMLECAEQHGLEIRFASDSCLMTAGGLKGITGLSEADIEKIERIFPHRFGEFYGCSELMALARKCRAGHFHMPPSVVSFVLDPDTGAPYPRQGAQTGRYAGFDLWAQTYWAGIITGDEVTVNWDGGCACGRQGPYLHDNIGRYSDRRGGDDKITCQRTAAAVEEMMQSMKKDAA